MSLLLLLLLIYAVMIVVDVVVGVEYEKMRHLNEDPFLIRARREPIRRTDGGDGSVDRRIASAQTSVLVT